MATNLRHSSGACPAVAAVALAAAMAVPGTGLAQDAKVCAPTETLVDKLGSKFGEAVTAEGVDDAGNLVQVFTSENGTWTIAVTLPGGPSCVVSTGEGWNDERLANIPKPVPQPDWAS
ncbi:MAG TPA: hypothetical protein VIR38_10520 [Thalassobaculum sp.]